MAEPPLRTLAAAWGSPLGRSRKRAELEGDSSGRGGLLREGHRGQILACPSVVSGLAGSSRPQRSPVLVERVVLATMGAVERDLDATAADVQGVTGQPDHVEGVHHRGGPRQFFGGGGLEAGEPVHRHDLHAVTPLLGLFGQPGLEGLFGASLDHRQQPRRPAARAHGGEVDDHGDVLVAAAGVTPYVLVDTDHAHAVEAAGLVGEEPLAFGQDSVVGGVPRDPEPLRDGTHREVVDHERFQRPSQGAV